MRLILPIILLFMGLVHASGQPDEIARDNIKKKQQPGYKSVNEVYLPYQDKCLAKIYKTLKIHLTDDDRPKDLPQNITFIVSIRSDGSIRRVKIMNATDNELASIIKNILYKAEPFEPFPDALKNEVDLITINRQITIRPKNKQQ